MAGDINQPLRLELPTRLTLSPTLAFCAALAECEGTEAVRLHCGSLSFAHPFGMLVTAVAIRTFRDRLRASHPNADVKATDIEQNQYAGHMGFWRACGIPRGKEPGQAVGSDGYLPITRVDLAALLIEPTNRGMRGFDVMCNESARLAGVLSQNANEVIETTLDYAIRELFRNVLEHSHSPAIWYCAQYWSSRDEVEVAVLDEGVGILRSLRTNPTYTSLNDEEAAIRMAVRPGVTRAMPPSQVPFDHIGRKDLDSPLRTTEHDNSGYGLHVLEAMALNAGSLVILSNDTAVEFEPRGSSVYSTRFNGTAIRLRLRPSKLPGLLEKLLEGTRKHTPPDRLTPSMIARLRKNQRP